MLISFFHKDRHARDGYSPSCSKCKKKYALTHIDRTFKYQKEYREKHKDKLIFDQKIYYKDNKEKILEQIQEYRVDNKDKIKVMRHNHYLKHKDKIAKAGREYYIKNKDNILKKVKAYNKTEKGKAVKMNTCTKRRKYCKSGDIETKELRMLLSESEFCYWCSTKLKLKQVDHYMPLSRGGEHTLANLVISCPKCNNHKRAKDPIEYANSIGRLL